MSRVTPQMDRPNRWTVMVRRGRRRMRPLVVLASLGAVGLGFAGGIGVIGHGDTFGERFGEVTARLGLRVREIVVEGQTKTPDAALRDALGLRLGDPILTLDLAAARTRIEAIQWVAHATVARRLPGRIVVRLDERSPFAVWQHDGRFVLIDREGNIVTDSDVAAFARDLPLVVGTGAPATAAAIIDALNRQPSLWPKVSAIVRVGARRWNIHTSNGCDVLLPEGAEGPALAKLVRLQASDRVLDRPLAAIDLRLPDRLTLRPFADPAPATTPATTPAANPATNLVTGQRPT